MHLPPLIFDLAIILAVAGVISAVFLKIRQPVVLGYILAGVVVGPFTPPFQLVTDLEGIKTWAELGIIFLMFSLGLEFSFKKLLSVGLTASITVGIELIFFISLGYIIGLWLGFDSIESLFLGAMISISSTTIILKAFEELKLKTHRFASIIFGVLIVEDLVAILLIVGLTSIAQTRIISPLALLGTGFNLVLVVLSWFIFGHLLVPRLMSFVAKRGASEMITLISIGLCLALVVFATKLGYSAALGAFIMGSILAESRINNQIENLMKPLKDLFGAIFFVSVGMLVDPSMIWEHRLIIIVLCLISIFGKLFTSTFGSLITGQSLKNAIQTGLGLGQIGEFSFIIAGIGVSLNAIDKSFQPIAVGVSIITSFTTPYLVRYSGPLSNWIEKKLPPKIPQLQNNYVVWWEHQTSDSQDLMPVLKTMALWILNGIIMTIILNNSFKGIAPKIGVHFPLASNWRMEISWLIGLILSSPFIWAMVFASKKTFQLISTNKKIIYVVFMIVLPVLTSVWIGLISIKEVSYKIILPSLLVFLTIIYFLLYKRLEKYYGWFEGRLKSTFNSSPIEKSSSLSSLAPWDTHFHSFEIHPNAHLVGKNLKEANLRQSFGVSVVAIQRGLQTIVSPKAHEQILPMDRFVVIGSDEQLDAFQKEVELPPEILKTNYPPLENHSLRYFELISDSFLVGLSLKEANLRDEFEATIVGVERKNLRMMNINGEFIFLEGDIIWVVAEKGKIEFLFERLTKNP
jgi:CPA2 family monovalent cation:H+ antiporter-2